MSGNKLIHSNASRGTTVWRYINSIIIIIIIFIILIFNTFGSIDPNG